MIKEIDKADLKQALDLVNKIFSKFVAVDYSEQGIATFQDYLKNKYEEVSADLVSGHKKAWGYYQNGKIIGVIATRDVSHIALMFVDKQHHRKGIARQLFDIVLANLKDNADVTKITVNSSPYAMKIYEKLGFIKTDERQEKMASYIYLWNVCLERIISRFNVDWYSRSKKDEV
jgi:ribosomal protein S18 acetylase RimI-like enzyme